MKLVLNVSLAIGIGSKPMQTQDDLPGLEKRLERMDNVTGTLPCELLPRSLQRQRRLPKDAIFDYVYGVLHAPDYRERFANDLYEAIAAHPPGA